MTDIAYLRVSTADQSVEAQRTALAAGGRTFAREFVEHGVSGAVPAGSRPVFR